MVILTFYWQLYFVDYHDYLTPSSHKYLQAVNMAVGYSCRVSMSTLEPLKLHKVGTDSLWNRMKISSLKLHMYKAHAPRASPLRMLDPWLSLYRSKHRYIEIFYFMQFRRAIYAISERTGTRFQSMRFQRFECTML